MDAIGNQRRQVEKHLTLLGSHEWAAVVDTFTGSAPAFEHVPTNMRFTGTSGIEQAIRELATAVPDLQIQVGRAIDVPGCSIREIVVIGTHLGAYQGLKATGRPVQFACACFFFFDAEGRLNSERFYFDNQTVLRQMRGEVQPYLPVPLRIAA